MGALIGGFGGGGFEMPHLPDFTSLFGGNTRGGDIGGAIGGAVGGLIPGMGGIGASVGSGVGNFASHAIDGVSSLFGGGMGPLGHGDNPWMVSDMRLKRNIAPMAGALDQLHTL